VAVQTVERYRFIAGAPVPLAVFALGALAVAYSTWPIWRALFPLEIDIDEPWNAYWADAVLQGRSLYPALDSLIINNYPPLSFYLIAGIERLGVEAIGAGRALSLLATVVASIAVGAGVRQLGGTPIAAWVGGLWFLATMMRFFDGYVGKNDPHLPALALMLWALVWLLRRISAGRSAEAPLILMAVAGFYKHSLIATPFTALWWLFHKIGRLSVRASVIAGAAAIAGLALCAALYGRAFFDQLLFPREHSLWWALGNIGQLQWVAPALAIWAVWAWYDRDDAGVRFTSRFIVAGLAAFFLQKLGMGIGVNAQFELVAATAIGLGLAFSRAGVMPLARRISSPGGQLVIISIVVTRLLLSNHVEPYLVLTSADYRQQFSEYAQITERETARIRAISGPVHCSILTICRRAGKAFVYDPGAADQRIKTGRLTERELADKIAAAGIRFETIDPRTSAESTYRRIFAWIR
jgi:hypothetical protein